MSKISSFCIDQYLLNYFDKNEILNISIEEDNTNVNLNNTYNYNNSFKYNDKSKIFINKTDMNSGFKIDNINILESTELDKKDLVISNNTNNYIPKNLEENNVLKQINLLKSITNADCLSFKSKYMKEKTNNKLLHKNNNSYNNYIINDKGNSIKAQIKNNLDSKDSDSVLIIMKKLLKEFESMHIFLSTDKILRYEYFDYMSNKDKIYNSFYKRMYEISQDYNKVNGAPDLYIHKFDNKILQDFDIIDFKKRTQTFFNNFANKLKFNLNCTFRF